ncbi:D-galactarate:H+ symporter [Xanthomonas citri pv. aurantifolii str. ICPB 10535]|nr:D-galactarate:H+ symporter [Xanthomonas citri pv. aurantifolii str. ICPB 10535]
MVSHRRARTGCLHLQFRTVLRHRGVRPVDGLAGACLGLGTRVPGDGRSRRIAGATVAQDHLRTARTSAFERDYIQRNGALVDMEQGNTPGSQPNGAQWHYAKQLLCNRMLLGVYIGQYCITTLTYFFLTWFPVYLVRERGMSILEAGFVASLPAVCGFIGGVLGGYVSDRMVRRGYSLTVSRKTPIVIGMLMSVTMIGCNYVQAEWMVVGLMALAFFGKGIGALGWAVVADTSPKEIAGLSGGLFNTFGNIAGITTPIVIGYIVSTTGTFEWALVFVGLNALLAVVSYLVIVGEIKRVELKAPPGGPTLPVPALR